MAFDIISLAKSAFKRSLGKAHTSNAKDLANEAIPSSFQVATTNVFGVVIPNNNPSLAVTDGLALDTTVSRLGLTLDLSSGGKSYFVTVPAAHALLGYINPTTGINYVVGDRVTRIIPQSFGDNYRPVLYNNVTEVPPLASQDWFLDCFAGVVTSEDDLSLGATGHLGAYVYIDKMLDEVLLDITAASGGGSGSEWATLQFVYNNGQTIDLDGYANLYVHSETDAYGLDVDVQGAVTLSSALDGLFHSDGYLDLTSNKTLRVTDGYVTNMRWTDPAETYGTSLLTTRKSLIGAINEAFLVSSGGAGGGSERATFTINSPILSATGLSLSASTSGSIELVSPEGTGFTFLQNVFIHVNGNLQLNDAAVYSGSVTNDVALSSDGLKLHFAYDLVVTDVVQVYNTASQV
jgi:hypothetical protein